MNYQKKPQGRYVRIPIPLKREAKPRRKSQYSLNLIERHKRFITWYQKKLALSDYALLWLVFVKGIAITLLVKHLFYK